jgi:hypothetical protein
VGNAPEWDHQSVQADHQNTTWVIDAVQMDASGGIMEFNFTRLPTPITGEDGLQYWNRRTNFLIRYNGDEYCDIYLKLSCSPIDYATTYTSIHIPEPCFTISKAASSTCFSHQGSKKYIG